MNPRTPAAPTIHGPHYQPSKQKVMQRSSQTNNRFVGAKHERSAFSEQPSLEQPKHPAPLRVLYSNATQPSGWEHWKDEEFESVVWRFRNSKTNVLVEDVALNIDEAEILCLLRSSDL